VTITIAPDDAAFDAPLERVLTAAFGPGRFAKVSERVREHAVLDRALSRIAMQDGAPVGCCRIYRIAIGGAPALFLGPLAVDPAAQGASLGKRLVAAALDACDATRAHVIVVVGQPYMFAPFGFVEVPRGRIALPGPVEARRLQWRAIGDHALSDIEGAVSAPRAAN
jgi:predicted N-acetyltransferase YhbS